MQGHPGKSSIDSPLKQPYKALLPVAQKLKFRRLLAADELDQPTLDDVDHLVHRSPAFPCKQLLSGLIESIAPVSEHVP